MAATSNGWTCCARWRPRSPRPRQRPGFVGELDDALYQQVIGAYVKRMTKALKEYEQIGGRAEAMADKLRFEVEYLARWLPQKLDEQATRMLVRQAIAESGVSGPQAVGRVVGPGDEGPQGRGRRRTGQAPGK